MTGPRIPESQPPTEYFAALEPMSTWGTGVAEVIGTSPRGVIVKCPHCGDTHAHARSMVGSNHVVAGCHTGYTRCREYRVVDMGAGRSAR